MSAKTAHIFKMVFLDESPAIDINSTTALMNFYICGRKIHKKSKKSNNDVLYDFKEDVQKIKSSFMAKFNFNPWERDYMHWWDFRACFESLLGITFENTIKARTMDLSGLKGEQLSRAQENKDNNKLWTKREITEQKEKEKADAEFRAAYQNGNLAEYLGNANKN